MVGQGCIACAGMLEALPVPHPARSVTSDGRTLPLALRKGVCPSCGMVSHTPRPDTATVRAFYGDDYDLAREEAPGDRARAETYARAILALAGDTLPPGRIVELGCGAGFTLAALAARWPDRAAVGLEPAPAVARAARMRWPHLSIHEGFGEDAGTTVADAALVYSVNVLEHTADPVAFLASKAAMLREGGRAIVVCPACEPPNMELVFLDHIQTLTGDAMKRLAPRAGLGLLHRQASIEGAGDFQAFVLASGAGAVPDDGASGGSAPAPYLRAWSMLDAALCERTSEASSVALFGAGEMAALLRAYAPGLWRRTDLLIADDTAGARRLDRPLRRTADVGPDPGRTIVVATHPRSQPAVARRLRGEGHRCVTFDDLIAR